MGRTALELMGQAGLGYSFDPLTDEESAHPYSQVIKELLYVKYWNIPAIFFIYSGGLVLPWFVCSSGNLTSSPMYPGSALQVFVAA